MLRIGHKRRHDFFPRIGNLGGGRIGPLPGLQELDFIAQPLDLIAENGLHLPSRVGREKPVTQFIPANQPSEESTHRHINTPFACNVNQKDYTFGYLYPSCSNEMLSCQNA